ncbi:MAG: FIST signal transduction protein [Shewanella sp.]
MKILRHFLNATDPCVLQQYIDSIKQDEPANLAIAFGNIDAILHLSQATEITQLATSWVATSSCITAFSDIGAEDNQNHLAILQFYDPQGSYGVASKQSSIDSIIEDSQQALTLALNAANRPGELPALIWCSQSPGLEEGLLTGIRQLVGHNVPVFGGTSADNDVSGHWCMFDGQQTIMTGFIIAVLFPSTPINYFFSSGYETTRHTAIVTSASGRKLHTLNHQPAASVYNQWRTMMALPTLANGPVLAQSTFNPLGRVILDNDEQMTLLSHPAFIYEDGTMELFSEVYQGEQLTFMHGNQTLLIQRAQTVTHFAAQQLLDLYDSKPLAAIVIFCAGCMLAIKDETNQVRQGVEQALGNVPFIGGFTFGEQGRFADGVNRHGNLMISAIIFGHSNE